jgi:hypothetical protein
MLFYNVFRNIFQNSSVIHFIRYKLIVHLKKSFNRKISISKNIFGIISQSPLPQNLSSVINSHIYAVAVINSEGFYVYTNEIFQKNFILEKEKNKFYSIKTVHQENADRCLEAVKYCFQNPHKTIDIKLQKSNDDHLDFYLTHWEFSALKNTNNQIIGIMCIGYDITPIKKISKHLDDSQCLLKTILNNTKDSYLLISPDYKVLYLNKVAKENIKLFFKKNIIEGDNCCLYMVKEMKEHFLYYFNLALQGKISIKEIEIPVSKNQSVWFLISFYPVYNQDNQLIGVSYNATNIHEIKEIATLLQKKNEMLMEIARIQSHEVRKPVAHILGLISIFNRENLNSENLKLLEYLKKSTQDLDAVIHRIVSETNPII